MMLPIPSVLTDDELKRVRSLVEAGTWEDGNATSGHQSALAKWIGKTPRSILQSYARKGGVDFTGTADHVAGMMQEIMEEVGGDGFLIFNSYFDRRYVIEVCDGLVPELQRRGVTRKAYAHKHLKDNLLEFELFAGARHSEAVKLWRRRH